MTVSYEKLGAFYLGRTYDIEAGELLAEPVLYDSRDLTTHAAIIGMTGSGKTGLGIGLIEEALIDGIPVIAIDPKGDLPNLLLQFPELAPADFRPWIDPRAAQTAGVTPDEYAAAQAKLWREGLAAWGQGPERIARLQAAAEMTVYTPGSRAGVPVSVLRGFAPPPPQIASDADLLRERVQNATTSLLTILGLDADPLSSREHILVANILEQTWAEGRGLDLAGLIHLIQTPPFRRVGVLDLEAFYPAKDRAALAMRLNNLLASPGFDTWLAGEALDIGRLLYGAGGRPRAAIFSIAHLGDTERMFFVTTLLGEVLSWLRAQSGTASLRALLYFDEIFGYLPPVANPPSKPPLLTLLKQARAYGLGLVVSTQNPVDLDYKALANAGTWMIGRLQTERDRERVLAGLEGAAAGALDRHAVEHLLQRVGKRIFYLHNVHEKQPAIFQTRWVLSYLAGPLTREQIRRLAPSPPDAAPAGAGDPAAAMAATASATKQAGTAAQAAPGKARSQPAVAPATTAAAGAAAMADSAARDEALRTTPPPAPPGIDELFVTATGTGRNLFYRPAVLGRVDVHYHRARPAVDHAETVALAAEIEDGPAPVDWDLSETIAATQIAQTPLPGADFAELPAAAAKATAFRKWQRDLLKWVRQNRPLVFYRAPRLKLQSDVGESEEAFRARLAQVAREQRDAKVAQLRRKYEKRFTTLQNRLLRAEQAIARESEQATSHKMSTAISFGTALLSAFLGRKKVSATAASRVGSAMNKASRIRKEKQDVERARERAGAIREQLAELEARLEEDVAALEDSYDPAAEEVVEIGVNARASDLTLEVFGLGWLPYRREGQTSLRPDWRE